MDFNFDSLCNPGGKCSASSFVRSGKEPATKQPKIVGDNNVKKTVAKITETRETLLYNSSNALAFNNNLHFILSYCM